MSCARLPPRGCHHFVPQKAWTLTWEALTPCSLKIKAYNNACTDRQDPTQCAIDKLWPCICAQGVF